ncbi:hypothetical protein MC7420_1837 [Coleofasciculus chthonoplastes PCC 7420]|uniref:Uncharacterized protein n=1 Tax=Coleofasciculus chthonoplastes PCC 7420 TaxID=118168 RepID=B4VM19_9CYAN|nr:hypothetical protein MC7420_1837 [Coleofasciculus chthonoplastes PCC 7420]
MSLLPVFTRRAGLVKLWVCTKMLSVKPAPTTLRLYPLQLSPSPPSLPASRLTDAG